jgi:DNA mismatch repair protein MLH3
LSITSRHHQHRFHNSITFHHAKAIERQLHASSYDDINGNHGTRVTVRNLFGNLPVRVKQRSRIVEQRAEHDRLWGLVKKNVAGLLLSWAGSVSLKARDANNRIVYVFNTSDTKQTERHRSTDTSKHHCAHLTSLLNILTQANYIQVDKWSSWVPVSASTSSLSIKGAISLDPAPNRAVQFISLGVRPLAAEIEYNELYDEVNRLFSLSTFGAAEDDVNVHVDPLKKARQQSDKQYRTGYFANRQLKTRKGVDRYPMFHLRILVREGLDQGFSGDCLIGDVTNVQTILQVLGAMISQWLSIHDFRPIHTRQKRDRIDNSSTVQVGSSENDSTSTSAALDAVPLTSSRRPKFGTVRTTVRKRKRSCVPAIKMPNEKLQHRAFAEWSRIKSGKAEFFTIPSVLTKFDPLEVSVVPLAVRANNNTNILSCQQKLAASTRLNKQALIHDTSSALLLEDERGQVSESATIDNNKLDKPMPWTDPTTGRLHLLNARTGCVMPPAHPRHQIDSPHSTLCMSHAYPRASLRLPPRTAITGKTPWLDGVLDSWDNSVFKTSEQRIEQMSLEEHEFVPGIHQHAQHQCSYTDNDKAWGSLPVSSSNKISKQSLLGAEVIAQVDKKFILVRVVGYDEKNFSQNTSTALLVLIDQHAADERVQVEALFQDLCSPATTGCSGYRSKLGHSAQVASVILDRPIQFTISQAERVHFTTYAARFALWGILFDMLDPTALSEACDALPTKCCLLSVTALPPTVSERCKADAGLLIAFLRSTVWDYASDPHLLPHESIAVDRKSPDWVRKLASCPKGLIDMINSRACRSAVMFNDDLDLNMCRTLVQRLATCTFPFICAHGRPSLVPLVNVEREDQATAVGFDASENIGDFVKAWKVWKK